jgi:hypothetical protein
MKRIHSPTNNSLFILTCAASDRMSDPRDVVSAVIEMKCHRDGSLTNLPATPSGATETAVLVTHQWVVPPTGRTSAQAQVVGVYSFLVWATLSNGDVVLIADDPVYRKVVGNHEAIDSN